MHERKHQILLLSMLKRKLVDLEMREDDEIRELEVERNLLAGEWKCLTELLDKVVSICSTAVIRRISFYAWERVCLGT